MFSRREGGYTLPPKLGRFLFDALVVSQLVGLYSVSMVFTACWGVVLQVVCMMGFVSHGVWVVLVCLFALWGGGAALVIGKQSEKMTHVSTCEGLKRALGHELPHQDVLVDEDITCTQEEWGEEPVIVYGEKMVMGVHIPPYDIPSVQFIDVVDGIVVAGEASLAIQKIRLKSEVSGQDPRGNGTHPPHFVKLLQSATLDFVGSQVCCPDCNIRVQEV